MSTSGVITDINFDTEDRYFFDNDTQTEVYEDESLVRISKKHKRLLTAKEWLPTQQDACEETLKNVPADGPKGMQVDGRRQLWFDDFEDEEPENNVGFDNKEGWAVAGLDEFLKRVAPKMLAVLEKNDKS